MKKLLLLLACILCVFATNPAMANDQDMGKLTCKELLASKDDIPFIMFWVDGYMSAKSDNLVLNADWMKTLTEHYISYCQQHPRDTILDTMEAIPSE